MRTPTSATNLEATAWLTRLAVCPRQSGYTLIELLVVIAIAAMLTAVVPSALGTLRDVSQYRDAVRSIVVELRQARQQAMAYGKPVTFRMDLNGRQFGLLDRVQTKLPQGLEVRATAGALTASDATGLADITFLPEGGATGGTIELVRHSGAGVRIRVDWLLGQVSQELRNP